jgi:thioredoxin-related protein
MHYTLRQFAVLSMGLLLIAGARADAGLDPYKHFFNDTFGDYKEELAHAREQGKVGVMMFFELDDCPWCHRMKETVLNQPQVQEYFRKHFLLFAIDIEGDIEMTDFSGQERTMKDWAFAGNRVRATPVFQFFDLDGKPTARYTGATSTPDEFLWLGEYVVQGRYNEKNMSFAKYKREKRGEK